MPVIQWTPEAIRFGTDPLSDATIEQLTSEPVTSTNIYCEQRFASADGHRIAISRKPFGQANEVWVCDLRSYRLCRIGEGTPFGANAPRNAIYYRVDRPDETVIMRLDLLDLSVSELYRDAAEVLGGKSGAVSPDERFLVNGPYHVEGNRYALHRTDLSTGKRETLVELDEMTNPHLQFEPSEGRWLNVQINRGGRIDRVTGARQLDGNLGSTLTAVDVHTGTVTPLPVGRPHTPRISGHECWVGATGELIFTAGQYQVSASALVTLAEPPEAERDMPAAAIYGVRPGDKTVRVVADGLLFNHIAASDDGRFFIADDHTTSRIYIGSIATGRSLPLCDSHTRQGNCQYSHVHAYMTPDNRHVIFNSVATGTAQVYAAHVPEGFLERILAM